MSSLLRRWELASVTWSSVSDLDNTSSPSNQKSRTSVLSSSRQSLSATDREGMRNIVGGRPESAPIYVRNANRMDGLQYSHCSSPNMPRHVLESISQSPTQSVKNSATPPGCASPIIGSSCYHQDDYGKECASAAEQRQQQQQQHKKISPYAVQNPVNGEYVTQQALYREQYLQQTGIITVTPQYSAGAPGGNVLRNNPYVQHFQIANPQHPFSAPRRRGFNAAQMT